MTTKHTPGPWRIDEYHDFVTPDGPLYLGGVTTPLTFGEDMRKGWENARRIVACVNACEGISTQNLEDNVPFLELARLYNVVLRERDALQAKIEQMGQQEPVGTAHAMPGTEAFTMACFHVQDIPVGTKLYALPGAEPVVTPKMEQAFYEKVEVTTIGSIRGLADGIKAAMLAATEAKP